MHRTLASLALAAALATAAPGSHAQDLTFGFNPRSGDIWMDTHLADINRYGSRYRDPFVDELVRYHGAPRDLVRDLMADRRWTPGDIYMACSIASIIGRPCRTVVETYDRDRGQGWGEIAKRMGIKPGSPEFHRLKRGFVPTYDRWARPIALDADLQRAFPKRPKGKAWVAPRAPVAVGEPHPGNRHDDGKGHGQGHSGQGNGKGNGKGKSHGKGH